MDDKPFELDRRDLIEGLGKGLRVIESFDERHSRLSATEMASRSGITRTAARRYLLSLTHFGYAATDGKRFWLQPRVLQLGRSYLASALAPRLVQPFAERISTQTGETVNYSVRDGHEVVCLVCSNASNRVTVGYQVGSRVPAHLVTSGVVMLAGCNDESLEDWIGKHDFCGCAEPDADVSNDFREQVSVARRLGYFSGCRALDAGLCSICVAVKRRDGKICGALGVTVPAELYTAESLLEKLMPPLQEAALALRPLL